jgi:hypothetical protein
VNHKYAVTVSSSSSDPHDWGRAMAVAMTQLAELVGTEATLSLTDLFDQDLHLMISATDDGVAVGLGWDPPADIGAAAETP